MGSLPYKAQNPLKSYFTWRVSLPVPLLKVQCAENDLITVVVQCTIVQNSFSCANI